MNVLRMIGNAVHYISEGVGRVFSPTDDEYPNTGVQPFDGEPFSEWVEFRSFRDIGKP